MYYFNNYQSQFQVQNSTIEQQSAEENRNNSIRDFIGADCDNCSFDHIFDQTIIEVTEAEKVASTRRIEDFGICLRSWRASLEHFLPVSSISC